MSLSRIVRIAIVACLYTVICMLTPMFSFGPIQIRLSESLTLLAVFSLDIGVGVTIGCFLSNMLVSAPIDMIVGTAATLVSALLTHYLRNLRIKKLALIPSIPPVIINAVVIGIELSYLYYPSQVVSSVILANILSVGLGQFISCTIIGVILVYIVEKNPLLLKLLVE